MRNIKNLKPLEGNKGTADERVARIIQERRKKLVLAARKLLLEKKTRS